MTARFLDRSRIVAPPPGWSRWLIPPAALSIHLAIGPAYAWSVFKIPLETSLGISGVASALPFTLGIVMFGRSAAVFGTTADCKGPRWAMLPARGSSEPAGPANEGEEHCYHTSARPRVIPAVALRRGMSTARPVVGEG